MLSEELLSYIRQNTQAGFTRAEIELALRNSGWSDADILTAFGTITQIPHMQSAPSIATSQVSSAQISTNAEIARIQEELRKSSGNKPTHGVTTETGLVGLLIRTNMASSRQGAKITLVMAGLFIAVVVYFVFLR